MSQIAVLDLFEFSSFLEPQEPPWLETCLCFSCRVRVRMNSSVDQVVEHACNEHSTSLNLSHLNITVVPVRLCKAKHLLRLQLNDNRLIMPPEEVGELDHLQELSLEHNQLTVLPSSLYRLSRLTYLNISYNPLGDILLCVLVCVHAEMGLSHWDPYAMHRGGCLELKVKSRALV